LVVFAFTIFGFSQLTDSAFANPSGERYAPDESKDAWQNTLEFLELNLKMS